MKKLYTYIFCLLAVACTKQTHPDSQDDNIPGNYVELQTKGTGSNRTFLFYMDGVEGTVTGNIETCGTYHDPAPGSALVPCSVAAADGSYISDDQSKGLRAKDGRYRMFIASPAIMPETVPGTSLKGYHYSREVSVNQGNPSPIMYISDPVDVNLNGVYLSSANGYEYVYDVESMVLKQPLSMINIRFACGDRIDETTLRKIILHNIISQGYYIPTESYFHYDAANHVESKTVFDDELHLLTGSAPVDLNVDEYILSMDYRKTDAQGNPLWNLPSLEIQIGPDDENVVTFMAALAWHFKPQHKYEFTITINSVYVTITVEAMEWEGVPGQETTVGVPQKWAITFPLTAEGTSNLLDWEKVDAGTGVIGGTTNQ